VSIERALLIADPQVRRGALGRLSSCAAARYYAGVDHTAAFITAFIHRNRRERYRLPGGFPFERVYHKLEHDLDPACMLRIPPTLQTSAGVIGTVRQLAKVERGVLIVAEGHCSPWKAGAILEFEELATEPFWYLEEVVVSFVPGRLAYFAPESYAKNSRFLLVKDQATRQRTMEIFQSAAPAKPP
jgi:hypothetical protein